MRLSIVVLVATMPRGVPGWFISHSIGWLSTSPAAVNSDLKNETIIPPHKWFLDLFRANKTPALVEADEDLIALEDEIDTVTAIHRYPFKTTTLEDHALVLLVFNIPKPLPTISKDSNVVTKGALLSQMFYERRYVKVTCCVPCS